MVKKKCCSIITTHLSRFAKQKLTELRFELLSHLAYSSDLAPLDYHLFPKLKTFLAGQKFESNEEIIQEANKYFGGLEETHFFERIANLEKHWSKCVQLREDYVKK